MQTRILVYTFVRIRDFACVQQNMKADHHISACVLEKGRFESSPLASCVSLPRYSSPLCQVYLCLLHPLGIFSGINCLFPLPVLTCFVCPRCRLFLHFRGVCSFRSHTTRQQQMQHPIVSGASGGQFSSYSETAGRCCHTSAWHCLQPTAPACPSTAAAEVFKSIPAAASYSWRSVRRHLALSVVLQQTELAAPPSRTFTRHCSMQHHQQPLIAWSVTSYRDSQLLPTLQSGLYQAHFASRLLPVVCWQGDLKAPCCSCYSISCCDGLSRHGIHLQKQYSSACVATGDCSTTSLPIIRGDGAASQTADVASNQAAATTCPIATAASTVALCSRVDVVGGTVSSVAAASLAPASSVADVAASSAEASSSDFLELRTPQKHERNISCIHPSSSVRQPHLCRTNRESPIFSSCYSAAVITHDAPRKAAGDKCTCWCHSLTAARSRVSAAVLQEQQTIHAGDSRVLSETNIFKRTDGSYGRGITSATVPQDTPPSALLQRHCRRRWRRAADDTAPTGLNRRATATVVEGGTATKEATPRAAAAPSSAAAASSCAAGKPPPDLGNEGAVTKGAAEDVCVAAGIAGGLAAADADSRSLTATNNCRARLISENEANASPSERELLNEPRSSICSGVLSAASAEQGLSNHQREAVPRVDEISADTEDFHSTTEECLASQRRCWDGGDVTFFPPSASRQNGGVVRAPKRGGTQEVCIAGIREGSLDCRDGQQKRTESLNREAFPLLELYRTCWAKPRTLQHPKWGTGFTGHCRKEELSSVRGKAGNSCCDREVTSESCATGGNRRGCSTCCSGRPCPVKPLDKSRHLEASSSFSGTNSTCSSRARVTRSGTRTRRVRPGSEGGVRQTSRSAGSDGNSSSCVYVGSTRSTSVCSVAMTSSSCSTKPSRRFRHARVNPALSYFSSASSFSSATCHCSGHTSGVPPLSTGRSDHSRDSWCTVGRRLRRRWSSPPLSFLPQNNTSPWPVAVPRGNCSVNAGQSSHKTKAPCVRRSSRSGRFGAAPSAAAGAATVFLQNQPLCSVQHLLPLWVQQQLLSSTATKDVEEPRRQTSACCSSTFRLSAEPPVTACLHLLSLLLPPTSSTCPTPAVKHEEKQEHQQERKESTGTLSAAARATRKLQPHPSHEELPEGSLRGRSQSVRREKCCTSSDSSNGGSVGSGKKRTSKSRSCGPSCTSHTRNTSGCRPRECRHCNSEDNRHRSRRRRYACSGDESYSSTCCRRPSSTSTCSISNDSNCSVASAPCVAQCYSNSLCKSIISFLPPRPYAGSRSLNSLHSASCRRLSRNRSARKSSHSHSSSNSSVGSSRRKASGCNGGTDLLHKGYAAGEGERLQLAVVDLKGPCTAADAAAVVGRSEAAENLRIRLVFLDWRNTRGPCFARYICEQMLPAASSLSASRGELLLLQTDSHMRFAPHYDCFLVRQLYLAAAAATAQERNVDTIAATTYGGAVAGGFPRPTTEQQETRLTAGPRRKKATETAAGSDLGHSAAVTSESHLGEGVGGVAAVQSEGDEKLCCDHESNTRREKGQLAFQEQGKKTAEGKRIEAAQKRRERPRKRGQVALSAEEEGAGKQAISLFERPQHSDVYSRSAACRRHSKFFSGSQKKHVSFLSCCVACGSCCDCHCSSCSCCCSVPQRRVTCSAKEQLPFRKQLFLLQRKNGTHRCTPKRQIRPRRNQQRLLRHACKPLRAHLVSKKSAHTPDKKLHLLQKTVLSFYRKRRREHRAKKSQRAVAVRQQKQPLHTELPQRQRREYMLLQSCRLPRVILTAYPPGYEEGLQFYEWPDSLTGVAPQSHGGHSIKEKSTRAAAAGVEAYEQRKQEQNAAVGARVVPTDIHSNDKKQCAPAAAVLAGSAADESPDYEPCVGAGTAGEASRVHSLAVAAIPATGQRERKELASATRYASFCGHALLPPVLLCAARFDEQGVLRTTGRVLRQAPETTRREQPCILQQRDQQRHSREVHPWRGRFEECVLLEDQERQGRPRQEVDLRQQHGEQQGPPQQQGLAQQQNEHPQEDEHHQPQHDAWKQERQPREVSEVCGPATLLNSVVGGSTVAGCLCSPSVAKRDAKEATTTRSGRPNDAAVSVTEHEARVHEACCCCCYKRALREKQGRKSAAAEGNLASVQSVTPSLFWAAGFSFGPARVVKEVGYDCQLPFVFFGEEPTMAMRLFTHGWQFFSPAASVVFHLWSRRHRPFFRQELHQLHIGSNKCGSTSSCRTSTRRTNEPGSSAPAAAVEPQSAAGVSGLEQHDVPFGEVAARAQHDSNGEAHEKQVRTYGAAKASVISGQETKVLRNQFENCTEEAMKVEGVFSAPSVSCCSMCRAHAAAKLRMQCIFAADSGLLSQQELRQLGFGRKRAPEDFWKRGGIDWRQRRISPLAYRGGLPHDEAFEGAGPTAAAAINLVLELLRERPLQPENNNRKTGDSCSSPRIASSGRRCCS